MLERSSTVSLPLYPNNALVYTATKASFEEGAEFVSYGLDNFSRKDNSTALAHFKQGMGYSQIKLKERYSLHPFLGWPFSEKFIRKLVNIYRGNV